MERVVEGDREGLHRRFARDDLGEGGALKAMAHQEVQLLPEPFGRDREDRRPVRADRVVAEDEGLRRGTAFHISAPS